MRRKHILGIVGWLCATSGILLSFVAPTNLLVITDELIGISLLFGPTIVHLFHGEKN